MPGPFNIEEAKTKGSMPHLHLSPLVGPSLLFLSYFDLIRERDA